MVRTTVMLPEELKDKTMRLARVLGVSFGEMVRTTLEREVSRGAGKRKDRRRDPFFLDFGLKAKPSGGRFLTNPKSAIQNPKSRRGRTA